MTNAMKLVKISFRITKDVKIQDGRQLWLKKSYSVLSKRQDNQIVKFNSHPYTLSLQCPLYSQLSQLSYESGYSHELWCRKCTTWHWNKYVFIFKFYLIHISEDILLLHAQNAIKQCKRYFSRKLLCQGLRKCKIDKSAIMLGCTATPSIIHTCNF